MLIDSKTTYYSDWWIFSRIVQQFIIAKTFIVLRFIHKQQTQFLMGSYQTYRWRFSISCRTEFWFSSVVSWNWIKIDIPTFEIISVLYAVQLILPIIRVASRALHRSHINIPTHSNKMNTEWWFFMMNSCLKRKIKNIKLGYINSNVQYWLSIFRVRIFISSIEKH